MVPEYHGACHCGALRFRYGTARPPQSWSVRACSCSFCRAHGVISTSDPAGTLLFSTSEEGPLQRYSFGSRSAHFLVCRNCGVYIGATMSAETGRFGIVNLRTLQPIPQGLPDPIATDFDGESLEVRLARRAKNWTPLMASSA
jgi:hypothetical protein